MTYLNYSKNFSSITSQNPTISQQPPKRRPEQKKRRKYKMLPLLISGLVISAIIMVLSILIYSAFCYFTSNSGNGSVIAPTLIYMLSIIAGCFWVSAVIRQRSLWPACILGVFFFVLSIVLSLVYFDFASFKLATIPLKLLFTILPVIFGFLLATIPNWFGRRNRRRLKQKPPM